MSNYDENDERPLLFKDQLRGRIMKKLARLRAKAWVYLMGDDSQKKKAKGTKKCVIKRTLLFENCTDCLFNDKIILQPEQRLRSDCHDVYREQINKIALSSNDDKRLQTLDKITTYPHRTNTFKVCES